MSVLKTATSCWRQAAETEKQAAQITDQHLKACICGLPISGWSWPAATNLRIPPNAFSWTQSKCATAQRRIGPLALVARESRGGTLAKAPFR
jgi:hypothetical protein